MNPPMTRPFAAAMIAAAALLGPPRVAAAPAETTAKQAQTTAQAESATLTLREALALALEGSPELAAFSNEVRAAEAGVLQAGVLPNPVLEVSGDNLGNARKADEGDRAAVIQIGQLIELGGKRALRIRLAEASRDIAGWDYEAKRIEILSQVTQRFVDVLAAQQRATLASESLQLAQQVADAVAKRVQAGKVSPVEETKARLASAAAQVELDQAKRGLIAVRNALGALWGNPRPRFEKAIGDLERIAPLPAYEQLAMRVRSNPDLARWSSEVTRRQTAIEAERAKTVPDVTVTAGVARFSQFDDHAYGVSISVPIPLFDRNQGGILEANRRLDKTADEQRAAEVRVLTELAQAYQRLAAIEQEIGTLRETLLPGAQSAYEAATRGYQLGKFGFLDVLDAQRTLFQTRSQNLRALADYQKGTAEIERLIGGPLDAEPQPVKRRN
jgi:cobalt-zinc-cadmium efflux system outer membrane protein